MDLFDEIATKIKGQNKTIVFPEGEDKRVMGAAIRLQNDGMLKPILLGPRAEIDKTASDNGFDISGLEVIDPAEYPEADKKAMFDALLERRKNKNTPEQVKKMLEDVSYFGTMLVYMGKADGMVSGAVHSTGATVRPALQIVKTKPNAHLISGYFLLLKGDQRYIFADSAINIEVDSSMMAEIAVQSAHTAKMFGIDPKVALLSFSTKGSAKAETVTKVADATAKVHELAPDLPADGELQFDAAFVPKVAAAKAPGSKVAGHANVFIFPNLDAGNIGYKIAQYFGGFTAIGPLMQGLNAPISDLSRGCNEDDVYKAAMIMALEASEK
ncbi:phosphate acetyltransferase [Limosilactobacillus kribbianus]|uniref:phosphate acetyltransferase n=1 Tax=Limosilactobacillus kribbianus TaxID=2982695 RepID=UPI0022642F0A|nr:phosphate acetyltransferase [Limosilactobacillus kribbianus]